MSIYNSSFPYLINVFGLICSFNGSITHSNSESAMAHERNWHLKGMGGETLIGLLITH